MNKIITYMQNKTPDILKVFVSKLKSCEGGGLRGYTKTIQNAIEDALPETLIQFIQSLASRDKWEDYQILDVKIQSIVIQSALETIVTRVKNNPNAPKMDEVLEALFKSPAVLNFTSVLSNITNDLKTPPETLKQIADILLSLLNEAVLQSASKSMISISHPSQENEQKTISLLQHLAGNLKTPPETLERIAERCLMEDEKKIIHPELLQHLAGNLKTPPETLKQIAERCLMEDEKK